MLLSLLCATLTIQFSYVIMLKGKEKVDTKHFRWLPPVHTTMLTLLAEEAVKATSPQALSKTAPLLL